MELYFSNCKNIQELRKKYLILIKENHPDKARSYEDFVSRNKKCMNINREYELLQKKLASYERINLTKMISPNDIVVFFPRVIDRKFYNCSINDDIIDDEVSLGFNYERKRFIDYFISNNFSDVEFGKLFQLSGFNPEKLRRTIVYFSMGLLSNDIIHENLASESPVLFIDDIIPLNNLPGYDSLLLFNKKITSIVTLNAWCAYCKQQNEYFLNRYEEMKKNNIKRLNR